MHSALARIHNASQ